MAINSIFASCRCMVSGAPPSSVMVLLLSVYNLSKSLIVVKLYGWSKIAELDWCWEGIKKAAVQMWEKCKIHM